MLAGDWLYMQAFKIAVQERNFRILDTLIELTQQMVEGELLQMEKLGKLIHSRRALRSHFPQNRMPVFRLHAAGSDSRRRHTRAGSGAGQYGHDLGMAFQIVDDVLDLTASEDVLGKPVASDLREGKATMAVIHALERCTPEERTKSRRCCDDGAFNGVTHGRFWKSWSATDRWKPPRLGPPIRGIRAEGNLYFPRFGDQARAALGAEFVVAREK